MIGETDRADWAVVVDRATEEHRRFLSKLRPIEHRSLMQPDGYVYCVRTTDEWETYPFTLESRVTVMQQTVSRARVTKGVAVVLVVLGVAPEQREGKLVMRPAILTTVMGVGRFEQWRYELVQQVEWTSHQVKAYGPLMRQTSLTEIGEWRPDECPDAWPRVVWESGPYQ